MSPAHVHTKLKHEEYRRQPEYSDKERAMLLHFVDAKLLEQTEPWTVYRVAAEQAFLQGATGPAADSLRRTFKVFAASTSRHTTGRVTPEWDKMIELEVSPSA